MTRIRTLDAPFTDGAMIDYLDEKIKRALRHPVIKALFFIFLTLCALFADALFMRSDLVRGVSPGLRILVVVLGRMALAVFVVFLCVILLCGLDWLVRKFLSGSR
jgi:hypothetical protein